MSNLLDIFYNSKINKELHESHVALGDLTSGEFDNRFISCLIRGIAIFFGTFGTIYGVLSAFDMTYNFGVIITGLLAFSIIFALFYLHKTLFYPGYILTMLIFTVLLAKYYIYTNSGYQAIINTIYEEYSDFFNLLSVREAQELVTNRYVTVTFAAMFMGVFIALLLNVTISGYMNLPETILVTFPFLEIAFYIGKKPSILAIIMVISCYIYVGIMQATRHGRGTVTGVKHHEFMRQRFKKKYFYTHQAGIFYDFISMASAIVLSIILVIVAFPAYQTEISKVATNKIRKETDEYVKTFVQTGVWGLLSRYDSTGGLSSGRLGGVGSVRPDFETDLEVTFAPYSMNTVYLKSFIGNRYAGDQWYDIVYYNEEANNLDFVNTSSLNSFEAKRTIPTDTVAKMTIKNIDANPTVLYEPYITDQTSISSDAPVVESQSLSMPSYTPIGSTLKLSYYPQINASYPTKDDELLADEKYYNYVYNTCLEVPDYLKPVLDDFLANAEEDILHTPMESTKYSNSINAYRLFCALAIYNQFYKDYKYTMQPGSTPRSEDFVGYFLSTQHRGYCAHFASSTVLLLREMGIPARYIEGYCIQAGDLDENSYAVDENYDDWFSGTNLLDEHGVLLTEVNDSQAHAWVEIYLDGYGFVPFEATIPSDGELDIPTPNFLSNIFGNLFDQLDIDNPEDASSLLDTPNAGKVNDFFNKLNIPTNSLTAPLFIIMSVFIGIIVLYALFRILYGVIRNSIYYSKGQYSKLIFIHYMNLAKKLSAKTKRANLLPIDCKNIYTESCNKKGVEASDASVFDQIEYALYSGKEISKDQYIDIKVKLKAVKKVI